MSGENNQALMDYACGTKPSTLNKTGGWRVSVPVKLKRLSPCQNDCLLHAEVPEWMEAVKGDRFDEAWQIMSQTNPFPALTGEICFAPCMDNCNRGRLDQEIDIPALERAIGRWRYQQYRPPKRLQQLKDPVAVIGSGPAGLSCAYYLANAGYRVTVFERSSKLGGMLALGIPEYRLPRNLLDQELAILEQEGISFITGCALGKDIGIPELNRDYKEIFFATGAWLPRKEAIPGEDQKGVHHALDFLCKINSCRKPVLKDPVIVIGGGNAALDSARSSLRLDGVNHVSLVYRRSRAEMPAHPPEVEAAEKEGVELIFNANPGAIIFESAAGQVSAVQFNYSRTNREGLVIDEDKSFRKNCGSVILALGQEPDYSIFDSSEGEMALFAGGDLVSGPATVPEAIRSGRLAAKNIIARLENQPVPVIPGFSEQPVAFEDLHLISRVGLELQDRQFSPELEAGRCLGCGTCNACGICYLFCPDLAVKWIDHRFELDLDYCKGCGICAVECPARALAMEGGM